ncbi:uncharacterized protein EV422DRAFT_493802 [Fimicolochytrium jonesii]|uniref:uncharacterized protein n=1 Tax=Fimicolochytrium jonesii TaxID=1396493 RepID=UPI0022FE9811|nr:uncharacterized protein EV422DRAFT_493802 [Fimicolochytrium jonesii]KAI8823600.1 hypothetical protein EV422DRAFT_493802 [Fimicolochytrium jonesii]
MSQRRKGRQALAGAGHQSTAASSSKKSLQQSSPSLVSVNLAPVSLVSRDWAPLAIITFAVTILQIIGLYLFSSGFLLTRLELSTRSECIRPDSVTAEVGSWCNHPPRYKRAVFMVLDALRYDFTLYNETLAEALASGADNSTVPFYANRLPILHETLRGHPQNALRFRVRADPPTTTLQRLKALTTGTLPTFVDAGSNFFGQVIGEDSIVDQFSRNNKRITFMGDDTWENMYPGALNESYPFPSLEVWDLHSVDNGILEHLDPVLDRTPKDWDLLIAHFLGVDHAGHRYGPDHPAMGDKLTQMNGIIKNLISKIDEETVLFIIGDHGMDDKGDHGGDSEKEVNAGLFIYSKKPLIETRNKHAEEFDPFVYLDGARTTPQIDFVPTISMLLGVPIPFGNLGNVIAECFFVEQDGRSPSQNLLAAARINARQIYTYIREYSQQRLAAKMAIHELEDVFQAAEDGFEALPESASFEQVQEVYLQYVFFARKALVAARKLWVRFDVPLIAMGCVELLLTIVSLITYAAVHWASERPVPWIVAGSGAALGAGLAWSQTFHKLLISFENVGDSALQPTHEYLFSTTFGLMVAYLIGTLVQCAPSLSKRPTSARVTTCVGIVLILLHTIIPASDSFTDWEDAITVYLLQAFGLVNLIWAIAVEIDAVRDNLILLSAGFMVLTRISQFSKICREEQHPWCIPTFYSSPHSSIAAPYMVVLLMLIIPVVSLALLKSLRSSDNDQAMGKTVPKALLPLTLFVSALYWALDTLDNQHIAAYDPMNLPEVKFWVARLGMCSTGLASLFAWTSASRCVGIELIQTSEMDQSKRAVCFLGIPNAVGGSYLVFLAVAYTVLSFFQKPMGGVMLGVAFLQILCLLEMLHLWRDKASGSSKPEVPTTPWIFFFLVANYLLGWRYYFATGHQNTLSSIQWDIGYVGVKQLTWSISPLLVVLNTFAGPLLFALAAPLYAMWKRPLLRGNEGKFVRDVGMAVLMQLAMVGATAVAATCMAGHFRRHLMVWRVFGPKFFFTAVTAVVVDLVVLVFGTGAIAIAVKGYASYLLTMKEYGVIK